MEKRNPLAPTLFQEGLPFFQLHTWGEIWTNQFQFFCPTVTNVNGLEQRYSQYRNSRSQLCSRDIAQLPIGSFSVRPQAYHLLLFVCFFPLMVQTSNYCANPKIKVTLKKHEKPIAFFCFNHKTLDILKREIAIGRTNLLTIAKLSWRGWGWCSTGTMIFMDQIPMN